ncbi:MAG TPA: hypothetical protein VMX13_09995 [Sedimentisphaerales bacterium]|nr:hypothetical protein [Sedimentisphaerales bacterium]
MIRENIGPDAMNKKLERVHAFVILFLLWIGIYLPGLGTLEFKGEEGRRVLPAVEMLRTGNWIVPQVGGEPYWKKPPFINWLVAVSFALTGEQCELSARFPSALFVLGFASVLVLMRSPWQDLSGRLMGSIIFMTSIGLIEKGRLIEIEAVYICLTGMAILWWLNAWACGSSAWSLWGVPSLILACSLLTKGPVSLLLFYITVVCVLVYHRRIKALTCAGHVFGVLLMLGVFCGWSYLAAQQSGWNSMTDQVSGEMFSRIRPRGFNFFEWVGHVLTSLAYLLPWLPAVGLIWRKKYTSNIQQEYLPLFKGCRLSLVLGFVLIVLMPGMHPRYTMPVLGLASVLLGWILWVGGDFRECARIWRAALIIGFLVSCVTATVVFVGFSARIWGLVVCAATICVTILVLSEIDRFRTPLVLSILTAILIVTLVLQYGLVAAAIGERYEKRRPLAASINQIIPKEETLYVYKPGYQAFLFYIRPPLEYIVTSDQIDQKVSYLLLKEDAFEELVKSSDFSSRLAKTLYEFSYRHKGDMRLVELRQSQ